MNPESFIVNGLLAFYNDTFKNASEKLMMSQKGNWPLALKVSILCFLFGEDISSLFLIFFKDQLYFYDNAMDQACSLNIMA